MKLLTIDIGNTTVDVCLFRDEEPVYMGRFPPSRLPEFAESCDLAVASSVKTSLNRKLAELFGEKLRFLTLSDIPLEVRYRTPETLGVDRVLFAFGVRELYAQDAVLVMAGTALVVDLLLEGIFRGGFITAGVSLKLRALAEWTEGIPSYRPAPFRGARGKTTEECVVGGTYRESAAFVRETARLWSAQAGKKLPIFITGGDGALFKELGTYDPLILHRAMHKIIING